MGKKEFALVCKQTLPTEQPSLVGELVPIFVGLAVSAVDPQTRIFGF
jgi:hypothetical protein